MEDEFKKVFDVLNNFLEIIGSNNGIIDEDLLNEHPELLFSLLGSISIQTENGLFTSYFYDKISDSANIGEYIESHGINLTDEEYEKLEIKYGLMLNNIEERIESIQVNEKSVMSFLSKLFNDVIKLKELINNTNYDNALKFLFIQYLKNIDLNKISDEIIQLFIRKVGKLELLGLLKKESSINDNYLLRKVYNNIELSSEEMQDLIDKELLIGIENFKNINQLLNDNSIIERLLMKQYCNIIGLLSEEQFIDNYSLIEPLLSNNMYKILTSCSCLKILSNGEIFDKVYNHIDNSNYIELFFKILPNDYSDKIRITKCLLQSKEYDEYNGVVRFGNDWLDNIELALKNGYKCNNITKISTTEELEIFIKYGQTTAIDHVDKKLLDYGIVNTYIQSGYNPKIDFHYSSFVLQKYMSEHKNTNVVSTIKTWLYFYPDLQYEFISENEITKCFTDEGPTDYFFEKILFNRKIILSLFKENGVINNNKYITDSMMQYINYVLNNSNLISFITKIEEIDIYFDEFGHTEKIYEKVFTSEEIFYSLFKNDNKYLSNFKDRYNCNDYVIKYLQFVKNYSLFNNLSQYVNNVNDVVNYYNAFGPTEKLYSLALFNPNLFKILFKDNEYISVCKFPKNIDNFIKFARTNGYIITFVNNIDDINKYFNEKGKTKELYLIGLFDKNYFNNMYNDYTYRRICNYSIEIEKYIQFVKANNIMFDFIKSVSDIEKYFNNIGPNQLLFEKGLTKYSLFIDLYRKNTYKNYCKFSNGVEYYISFIKKYGIMFDFIKDVKEIEMYFGENGATISLKNYFKENKDVALTILNSAAHNNQILDNLGYDFVDIFKEFIKDNYFNNVEESKREEKYEYLLKNIGPQIIFNLESSKIQRFIEIDISELDKFFKVIHCSNVKLLTPEMSYNNLVQSILRYKFEKENSELINIFTNVKSLLEHMNKSEFEKYIEGEKIGELSLKLDYYLKKIIEILNIDKEDLKNAIIKYKMEFKEDDLHKYCRAYVKKCRTSYTSQHKDTILSELGVPLSYDKEDAIKKMNVYFMKEMTYRDYWINLERLKSRIPVNEYKVLETITIEEFELIVNRDKKPNPSIVKKIKPFNIFLSEYSKDEFENGKSDSLLEFLNVKKENYIVLKDIDVIEIIKEFDIDIYLNTIGKDDELIDSLSKIFKNLYLGRLISFVIVMN